MYRETYECVKKFCYLGGNVGADLAATARIRNGWMKFREPFPFRFVLSRAPQLQMEGQVNSSCVRSSMVYVVEITCKIHESFTYYNKVMGGVDTSDQITDQYASEQKTSSNAYICCVHNEIIFITNMLKGHETSGVPGLTRRRFGYRTY